MNEYAVWFVELTHGTKGTIQRKSPPHEGVGATVTTKEGILITGKIKHLWASDHELEEARVF
jgi:hypothetical protein